MARPPAGAEQLSSSNEDCNPLHSHGHGLDDARARWHCPCQTATATGPLMRQVAGAPAPTRRQHMNAPGSRRQAAWCPHPRHSASLRQVAPQPSPPLLLLAPRVRYAQPAERPRAPLPLSLPRDGQLHPHDTLTAAPTPSPRTHTDTPPSSRPGRGRCRRQRAWPGPVVRPCHRSVPRTTCNGRREREREGMRGEGGQQACASPRASSATQGGCSRAAGGGQRSKKGGELLRRRNALARAVRLRKLARLRSSHPGRRRGCVVPSAVSRPLPLRGARTCQHRARVESPVKSD